MKIEIYNDITPAIKEIRDKVFIVEQAIAVQDEYEDNEAEYVHFCMFDDAEPIACTRMQVKRKTAKITRVAVMQNRRGLGIGKEIMLFTEAEAQRRGCTVVEINAQIQAKGFYEKLGYKTDGQQFLEAGISHIKMKKQL